MYRYDKGLLECTATGKVFECTAAIKVFINTQIR